MANVLEILESAVDENGNVPMRLVRRALRWIPCSERLPEIGKTVLWCNKHGSVFVSSITFKAEKCEYFTVGKHFDVVAWMPSPEPYREEKHDSQ